MKAAPEMTTATIADAAGRLLQDAIKAGRLTRTPDAGTLARIAGVLRAGRVDAGRATGTRKKNRHGLDTVAIAKEANASGTPTTV
jgi:hypothetical protein